MSAGKMWQDVDHTTGASLASPHRSCATRGTRSELYYMASRRRQATTGTFVRTPRLLFAPTCYVLEDLPTGRHPPMPAAVAVKILAYGFHLEHGVYLDQSAAVQAAIFADLTAHPPLQKGPNRRRTN